LLEALILSLLFRDLGLLPELREKYRGEYHPADHAQAGAYFVEKEKFGLRYGKDEKVQGYLTVLVRYHNLFHHMIRGSSRSMLFRRWLISRTKTFWTPFF